MRQVIEKGLLKHGLCTSTRCISHVQIRVWVHVIKSNNVVQAQLLTLT